MGSALLAIDTGLMGPNYSISTACATANYCFYAAANHIIRGEAYIMVVGGTEVAVMPTGVGGFIACRALSQRNDEPHRASRPWDKNRDGFVMGEGAGVLVMESLESALKRGAPIQPDRHNLTDLVEQIVQLRVGNILVKIPNCVAVEDIWVIDIAEDFDLAVNLATHSSAAEYDRVIGWRKG
ncbi:hypothetical protein ACFX12_021389 [Malus domestica]